MFPIDEDQIMELWNHSLRVRYARVLKMSEQQSIGIAHCWACNRWVGFVRALDNCLGHYIRHDIGNFTTICYGSGTPIGKTGSRASNVTTIEYKTVNIHQPITIET